MFAVAGGLVRRGAGFAWRAVMANEIPTTMNAAAIDEFGGPDRLKMQTLPVPELADGEVLIRLEFTGTGVWDPLEAKGFFADIRKKMGNEPSFPYIVGFEGSGTIAAVGGGVDKFKPGDAVWANAFLNPKGGFFAEYVAVDADTVSHLPDKLTAEQAGGLGVAAMTALRGLDDTLGLEPGQAVLIHGASGGVGHVAVQLAKTMGARVLAVASGADGVELCEKLGADRAVDGKTADVVAAARDFAPDGLDAVLLLAPAGPIADALKAIKDGGTIAFPTGVDEPRPPRDGIPVKEFSGIPDRAAVQKLDELIAAGPFTVHVAKTFPLGRAAEAWEMLETHFLGKVVLTV